jgi:transposase
LREKNSKGDGYIYQENPQIVNLLENQPDARFYENLFKYLDVSPVKASIPKMGRPSEKVALFRSCVAMKCEKLSKTSELLDYLKNNLLVAAHCGFDLAKGLPSYWTFNRYVRKLDNAILKEVMKGQVLELVEMKLIDGSFAGLDSTPNAANTKQNNPKSFMPNKFDKENRPKSDKDCSLGVHTASNQHTDRNYEFYWGYKNHVLSDCITGLPIYEMTTGASTVDSAVAVDILAKTHSFLSLEECSFIGDAGYDIKEIYNTILNIYHGDCYIPINPRNTKNPELLPIGVPLCDAGLAMHKCGKRTDTKGNNSKKFSCPFRLSKTNSCPCNHPKWLNGKKIPGCTKYITIPDDYRLSFDRKSKDFKDIYKLRTECERYNSRFKATGQERLWVTNFNSAQNLNSFAHIALLAVAIAAVNSKSDISYRAVFSLKRYA